MASKVAKLLIISLIDMKLPALLPEKEPRDRKANDKGASRQILIRLG